MFRRWPGYQTPSWFIALLFVTGAILDFQRVAPGMQDDQMNVRSNSRKRVTSSEILQPLKRSTSIAEN